MGRSTTACVKLYAPAMRPNVKLLWPLVRRGPTYPPGLLILQAPRGKGLLNAMPYTTTARVTTQSEDSLLYVLQFCWKFEI